MANKNVKRGIEMRIKMIITLMIVFSFINLIPNISAIGISPGRTSIDFSPNLEKEVLFSVSNTENKDMDVAFTIEGELAEYIALTNEVVNFNSSESSKEFRYKLNLPASLSPGLHKAYIIVVELPEGVEDVELIVKATVSVVTQVYVYVPYPGKYIEVSLDIVSKEESNLINFYIPLISRGEEKINSVKGIINIYKGDEKVASLDTNELSLEMNDKKELSAVWDPDVFSGEYKAVASVNYDGDIKETEKKFNVGDESLEVLGVSVNNFKLGDVARIKILVQSRLLEGVKKSFANLKVYDSELQKIEDLKSESYEILPNSNKEMIVYWDTEKLDKGEYGSDLKVYYGENFIAKKLKIQVVDDSMVFTGVGFVIASETDKRTSVMKFLYIIIGFLVLINLVWLVWWLRNKKKK